MTRQFMTMQAQYDTKINLLEAKVAKLQDTSGQPYIDCDLSLYGVVYSNYCVVVVVCVCCDIINIPFEY